METIEGNVKAAKSSLDDLKKQIEICTAKGHVIAHDTSVPEYRRTIQLRNISEMLVSLHKRHSQAQRVYSTAASISELVARQAAQQGNIEAARALSRVAGRAKKHGDADVTVSETAIEDGADMALQLDETERLLAQLADVELDASSDSSPSLSVESIMQSFVKPVVGTQPVTVASAVSVSAPEAQPPRKAKQMALKLVIG